jgi:hypothetical protein
LFRARIERWLGDAVNPTDKRSRVPRLLVDVWCGGMFVGCATLPHLAHQTM